MSHTEDQKKSSAEPALQQYSPIVELRQYTLHSGQRDVLIELFEREFIESQEAVGAIPIGQFRDLEKPDRFVWLRGFPNMEQRQTALQSFYGGPVWREHRNAANATMIDSDNVLLLRPARPTSGFWLDHSKRAPQGSRTEPPGLIIATILPFASAPSNEFLDFFEGTLAPELKRSGASLLAYFVTEERENNYPALPVREGEQVFIWFSSFRDQVAYAEHRARLAESQQWHQLWEPTLQRLKAAPEILKLTPTARSLVHA
ncbi:NIPSNAP family containing protein [Ktedonosporobacter rubrisoli]|uniref:NIPSNAP family containing protein n=1 Tax=Ktedonosporobacter rubrisoli TaxID=2509675 RepID=A0A4P6JJM0_KTERU|nr:NIPSNAP family protein [Ktedonosporobacter rubrisoli]QBD75233.1 NIPSNAP family containing protein [Ktedonosporobacter rubrisoli]